MTTTKISASLLLALALGLSGCFGPITATKELNDAEVALERARVADANERAPYEYFTAEHYLQKAKEEWGYSDFQASNMYAAESRRHAERALTKAKEDPFTGSPVPESKQNEARLGKKAKEGPKTDSQRAQEDADILEDVNAMEEE